MLTINYFASIRESVGLESEKLDCPENIKTVADLIEMLVGRGDTWQILAATNVLVAVNQQISASEVVLSSSDEIAFFPPVTGG